MAESPPSDPGSADDLGARLEALGRSLGEREAGHREGLAQANAWAEQLRGGVASALERFHAAVAEAGAPHLRIALGEIRVDEKHLRAVEFTLERGRHKAIVTVKSRGDVTLVGPFHIGKAEGPCRSFPLEAEREIQRALGAFLEHFVEEAATP
jgi:hypothetical protein